MLTVPLQSTTSVSNQSSKLDVVGRPDTSGDRDSVGGGSDETTYFATTGCDGGKPLLSSTTSATTVQLVATITIDFRFIAPLVLLVVFNLVVIIGNSLVVAAVFTSRKLRTVTNVFIVSLAMSDLLLGLLVLPSSSAHELLGGRWPFGNIWCQAWLAIDVWLCTASILNLCAISFDRYLAISRPFRYPTLMSPFRAKIAVVLVWTTALAVCMPPLLGWRDSGGSIASSPTTTTMQPVTATTLSAARRPAPHFPPTRLNFDSDSTINLLDFDNNIFALQAPTFSKTTEVSVNKTGSTVLRHRDSIEDVIGKFPNGTQREISMFTTTSKVLVLDAQVLSKSSENLEAVVFSGSENSSGTFTTPLAVVSPSVVRDASTVLTEAEATIRAVVPHNTVTFQRQTASPTTIIALPILDSLLSADHSSRQNALEINSVSIDEYDNHIQLVSTTPSLSRSQRSVSGPTSQLNFTHQGGIINESFDDYSDEDYMNDALTISIDYMQCALTSDPGYIVYSACGSFWIPMFIMVSFYVRIYRTAVRATNALRRGVLTTKTGSVVGLAASADSSVNLRVHRGGGGGQTNPMSWARASIRFSTNSRGSTSDVPRNQSRRASDRSLHTDFRNRISNLQCELPVILSTQSSGCDSVSGNESVAIAATGAVHGDGDNVISNVSSTAVESDYTRRFSASNSRTDYQKCVANTSMAAISGIVANGRRSSQTSNNTPVSGTEVTDVRRESRILKRSENGVVQFDDVEEVPLVRRYNKNPQHHHQQQLQQQQHRSMHVNQSTSDSKQRVSATSLPTTTSDAPVSRMMRSALLTSRSDSIDTNDDDDESTSPRRTSRCGSNGDCIDSGGIEVLLRSALTPVYEHCPAVAAEMRVSSAQLTTSRRGLLNIKTQLSRLNREKKAAKTVGIIVGCFVLCWTPFFTVYVLGAFCDHCTPSVVFSVFFWLGYCNSAINPFVYALCSNDFREAFRRLLRCGRVGTRRNNNRDHLGLGRLGARGPTGDSSYGLMAFVRGLRGVSQQRNRWRSGDESISSYR